MAQKGKGTLASTLYFFKTIILKLVNFYPIFDLVKGIT